MMFWFVTIILLAIFFTWGIVHKEKDIEAYLCFILIAPFIGFIVTSIGSLILMHSAPTAIITEINEPIVELEDGIYAYSQKNSDYYYDVFTEDENGLPQKRTFHITRNDVIYSNKYEPTYYYCDRDYEDEILRKLFWKCSCDDELRVILPPNSLKEID